MSRDFSLAGLLRLRRLQEDQRAVELNSARQLEAIGAARTRRIRSELAESTVSPGSHAALVSIAATRASMTTMLADLTEADRHAAGEVQRAAEAYAGAHRSTLGLEKLQERASFMATAEELKAEQLLLDDLSARAWRDARPETHS